MDRLYIPNSNDTSEEDTNIPNPSSLTPNQGLAFGETQTPKSVVFSASVLVYSLDCFLDPEEPGDVQAALCSRSVPK